MRRGRSAPSLKLGGGGQAGQGLRRFRIFHSGLLQFDGWRRLRQIVTCSGICMGSMCMIASALRLIFLLQV